MTGERPKKLPPKDHRKLAMCGAEDNVLQGCPNDNGFNQLTENLVYCICGFMSPRDIFVAGTALRMAASPPSRRIFRAMRRDFEKDEFWGMVCALKGFKQTSRSKRRPHPWALVFSKHLCIECDEEADAKLQTYDHLLARRSVPFCFPCIGRVLPLPRGRRKSKDCLPRLRERDKLMWLKCCVAGEIDTLKPLYASHAAAHKT
eukprot:CAMPEP_0170183796 /NCGR_PEP_ID=MMETSP0040_2-20121228/31742_1 /TAXON_ID=641309 /ORGANISM="Lotharella oceanica, Strain CCMP622" /LENGTH=202 /DNA_ID=CAMNT_0010429643 /DNA_START=8 /DNA_END=616 /DNA_ORIENTATION=+